MDRPEIARIGSIIVHDDTFIATAEEMTALCGGEELDAQFRFLARLALQEKWRFILLPIGEFRLAVCFEDVLVDALR